MLLPAAFRSLSRPSSASGAKASALCSYSLNLLARLLNPRLRCCSSLRCSCTCVHSAPRSSHALPGLQNPSQVLLHYCFVFRTIWSFRSLVELYLSRYFFSFLDIEVVTLFSFLRKRINVLSRFSTFVVTCLSDLRSIHVFKVHACISTSCCFAVFWWRIRGLEPLTPCVQGRCSPS